MSAIVCQATLIGLEKAGTEVVLVLPSEASAQLPARGMVAVQGTISGVNLVAVLEPDGNGSHWFRVSEALQKSMGVAAGGAVALVIESTKNWPEPKVPSDLAQSLSNEEGTQLLWQDLTTAARWDWIRWINAAKQPETRQRRVDSIGSRLKAGKRRPCCFDRSQCTLTDA